MYKAFCFFLLVIFLPEVTPCFHWHQPTTPTLWDDNKDRCQHESEHQKIIGGDDVGDIRTWPWALSVKEDGFAFCGASLISSAWAVTAAHCIDDKDEADLKVRFGDTSVEQSWWDWLQGSGERGVSKFFPHPDYDGTDNDIALLKLSSKVHFTDTRRPICLHEFENEEDFDECWVIGWGYTSNEEDDPDVLQELEVTLLPDEDCQPSHVGVDLTKRLCTTAVANEGFCDGDSGGPLSCKDGDYWYLAGIVEQTGDEEGTCAVTPDVYTREFSYLDWIKETVDNNGGPDGN